MRLKTRTWIVISLLCFAGAWYFWRLGEQKSARDPRNQRDTSGPASTASRTNLTKAGAQGTARPVPLLIERAAAQTNAAAAVAAAAPNTNYPYRLSNTTKGIGELTRSDSAILLRNALIDTASPTPLRIPDHLRAQGDPGSYIVQSVGKMTDAFRARLRGAGATIVSYVPNNAYLVRVSEGGALQMSGSPETQTVLKWEPYYKPSPKLLPLLIEQQNPEMELNVAAFPGEQQNARDAFEKLNIQIVSEDRSPFGPQFHIHIPANTLVPLAQLPIVAIIEPFTRRVPANDLSRARVRVSSNTTVAVNYRGLDGSNVVVNVNDTGVYADHVDLTPRVTGDRPRSLSDSEAHGTHVAGIIASSGQNGPSGQKVRGSTNGASFRGMAPAVSIYSIATESLFPSYCFSFVRVGVSDSYLQEHAALTNALVSNNSWGYGDTDYNLSSASWDGAVRDALPGVTGPQPLLPVFSAGNSGRGNDQGTGGTSDTVASPGNSKNVITVGAIENYRRISNSVTSGGVTNQYFLSQTDSSNQVASFSSRGNVGIGQEGDFGRFKPDVVAPGTFVVSTKPPNWTRPLIETNFSGPSFPNLKLGTNASILNSIFVPPNGIALCLTVETNGASPYPFPPILIHLNQGSAPGPGQGLTAVNSLVTNVTTGDWFYSVENTNKLTVNFDFVVTLVTTNSVGDREIQWNSLDAELDPKLYRYESGTSMSAPVVSGVAALIQQGLARDLQITNPSPALLKALLINGSRSVNSIYNYRVNSALNYQGWGLVNITNSFPESLQSGINPTNSGGLIFFDQTIVKPLATGQSYTRKLTMSSTATRYPLRVTLAWTDPPGNPAVATKLVNNLDLIVTNLDSGDVYLGNYFDGTTLSTEVSSNTASTTNLLLFADNINNVENIVVPSTLNKRLGTNYSVTVVARRVDVNSVDTVPDTILQDYALVVASDNPILAGAVTLNSESAADLPVSRVTVVTNGDVLLHQRVGANDPYLVSTNGNTNQWTFYIFTNTNNPANTNVVAGPYIAFLTFLPPNLSRPRFWKEADIDMYVSRNSTITNLDPVVLQAASRGVKRTGTETVFITNANIGEIFYVAIKSEDQQGGEFAFFAVSSDKPFSSRDSDGNLIATGYVLNSPIPDGSNEKPQAALVNAFIMEPVTIDNVIVTNVLFHQSGGDLQGNLSHDDQFVVLNNHDPFNGTKEFVYDDSDSGEILISQPSIGPGSLRNFIGKEGSGSWLLTMVDNALNHTGIVDRITLKIRPQPPDLGTGINRRILPNRWTFTSTNVPADATRLEVCVAPDVGPVDVYIRRGDAPDQQNYDTFATISPPGDCINITRFDSPPLSQGLYIIGIYNPNFTPVNVRIRVNVERDFGPGLRFGYATNGFNSILDDATTNSTIFVNRKQLVADINVGVRIDHPRVSELALHLVSPQGTRVLLYEDRGGPLATNLGLTTPVITNVPTTAVNGSNTANTNTIALTNAAGGTLIVDYDFQVEPDYMHVYYDGALIFDSDLVSGTGNFTVDFGPGFSTNLLIVMNEGDNDPSRVTYWSYNYTVISGGHSYVTFTENTNKAFLPIKFAAPPYGTNLNATNSLLISAVNDFEGAVPNDYFAGNVFDNWTELTNGVTVFNDKSRALSNNQFLALADGQVTRSLTTIAGGDYRLRYSYQRECVSALWEFEGGGSDAVDTNDLNFIGTTIQFTQGISGLAFALDGSINSASAGASPGIDIGASSNLTIECWIWPTNNTRSQTLFEWSRGNIQGVTFSLTPGLGLQANIADTAGLNHAIGPIAGLDITRFHHVALTYSSQKSEAHLYIDGVSVAASTAFGVFRPNTTNDLSIGTSPRSQNNTHFAGFLDDVGLYNCALSGPEIAALYRAGTNGVGKCDAFGCASIAQIAAGPATRSFRAGTGWQFGSVDFTASTNVTPLTLKSLGPLSMLFDSFDLLQKPSDSTLYFLPEESLNAFLGQNAYGDWTLEVTDTRTGNALTNGTELVSWKLNIEFVATNRPATILTNGQCISGTLDTNESAYFIVNVPVLAAHATNHLIGINGPLNLLYNTNGLPAGQFYARSLPPLLYFVRDETAVIGLKGTERYDYTGVLITSNATPRLPRGGRYYLAIENKGTKATDFSFCVDFDKADTLNTGIPLLVSGVCLTNTIQNTNSINHYAYNASSNAVQLIFEVRYPSDWVAMAVNQGLPLPYPNDPSTYLPGLTDTSLKPGNAIATNWIRLQYPPPFSGPGTNLGGTWFIGVGNLASGPVSYCVVVTEVMGINPTVLTNNTQTNVTTSATNVDYFAFDISSNACRADFEVLNIVGGNVDLYIIPEIPYYPPPPGSSNYVAASTNAGTLSEIITLTDTSIPALTPGRWLLAVENKSTTTVTYSVRVTEYAANPIALANGVRYTNTVGTTATNNVDYYSFNASPNAIEVLFELLTPTNTVKLFAGRDICQVVNATNIIPATNDVITLLTNSGSISGTWYLGVTNIQATNVTYVIRATEIVPVNIVRLSNAVPYTTNIITASVTNRGIEYYVFTVSANAIKAVFETYGANGNVDLYVKQGLPLPDETALLRSTNAATANELIMIGTNTTPPISAGDWYLAVYNRDPGNVNYTVRAYELGPPPLIRLTNSLAFTNIIAPPNGTTNLGVDYYFFTVSNNAVEAYFETFSTNGNVDLYVKQGLPLPDETALLHSTNSGTANELITVATNSAPTPLTPGDWYLAVYTRDTNNSVRYTVRASQLLSNSIVTLTNCVGYSNIVSSSNATVVGSGISYFRFVVSNNAVQANFEILNPSTNVDLFVRKGLSLPNTTNFWYQSTNLVGNEFIAVTNNASSNPLSGGEWYLAVVNRTTNNASFTVRASQFAEGLPTLIRLTSGIAYNNSVTNNELLSNKWHYYVFEVSSNAQWATFQITRPTNTLEMVVRKQLPLPTLSSYDYQSGRNSGPNTNDVIVVTTNSSPVALSAGDWYIGVLQSGPANPAAFNYSVLATEYTNAPPIPLVNCLAIAGARVPPNGTDYYLFRVAPNGVQANFETLNASGNVDLYIRRGLPVPSTSLFAYASLNPGTNNELIVVTNGAPANPLAPGDWYLAVVNKDAVAVTYDVRVSQFIDGVNLITLTNGSPYIASAAACPPGGIDYYRYTVTNSSSQRAQFEILSPNEDVDLIVTKGLPLPTLATAPYRSTNSATSDELITVLTPSLTPGDWYLGVIRKSANSLTYTVKASEFAAAGTNLLITAISVASNSVVCLTWTNAVPGVHYYVQGKTNLLDPFWDPLSPTLTATNPQMSYCVLLDAHQFFRISEGLSAGSSSFAVSVARLTASASVNLSWSAPTNRRFQVQWSATLSPAQWTTFPTTITSTTGTFQFSEPATQTSRFYRVVRLP